jgi:hypothetical protein
VKKPAGVVGHHVVNAGNMADTVVGALLFSEVSGEAEQVGVAVGRRRGSFVSPGDGWGVVA